MDTSSDDIIEIKSIKKVTNKRKIEASDIYHDKSSDSDIIFVRAEKNMTAEKKFICTDQNRVNQDNILNGNEKNENAKKEKVVSKNGTQQKDLRNTSTILEVTKETDKDKYVGSIKSNCEFDRDISAEIEECKRLVPNTSNIEEINDISAEIKEIKSLTPNISNTQDGNGISSEIHGYESPKLDILNNEGKDYKSETEDDLDSIFNLNKNTIFQQYDNSKARKKTSIEGIKNTNCTSIALNESINVHKKDRNCNVNETKEISTGYKKDTPIKNYNKLKCIDIKNYSSIILDVPDNKETIRKKEKDLTKIFIKENGNLKKYFFLGKNQTFEEIYKEIIGYDLDKKIFYKNMAVSKYSTLENICYNDCDNIFEIINVNKNENNLQEIEIKVNYDFNKTVSVQVDRNQKFKDLLQICTILCPGYNFKNVMMNGDTFDMNEIISNYLESNDVIDIY
ncbi:hypothetical protein LUQ84_001918 [Hamiltosporidium tvaerminnensis]|nr:hypothetical protein LUQ84_001918 [Hamiltosporidium tvaerminnensis]